MFNHLQQPRTLRLSALCRDPYVRAAFRRSERDLGGAFVVPQDPMPRSLPPCGAVIIRQRELVAQD